MIKGFWWIFNYVLDLVYETDENLQKILTLNNEDLFFVLKNIAFYDPEVAKKIAIKTNLIRPKIKIYRCKSKFQSLGHHLSGANFHVFNYHDERIQSLIWQLKFNDNINVSKIFGYCLAKNIYEAQLRSKQLFDFFSNEKCYLIPVPIHYKRYFERGYNQCVRLCQEIIKNLRKKEFLFQHKIVLNQKILKRHVYTQKQSWTKNENRNQNIQNVFTINHRSKSKIIGAKIILIDDVFTTGATINEASRTLMEAGASEVISFTIAR